MHALSENGNTRALRLRPLHHSRNEVAKSLQNQSRIESTAAHERRERVSSIHREKASFLNGRTDIDAVHPESWQQLGPVWLGRGDDRSISEFESRADKLRQMIEKWSIIRIEGYLVANDRIGTVSDVRTSQLGAEKPLAAKNRLPSRN